MKSLIAVFPNSLHEIFEEKKPIDYILLYKEKISFEIIKEYLYNDLPIITLPNGDITFNDDYSYSWFAVLDPHRCPIAYGTKFVTDILAIYRKYASNFAHIKDPTGREAISITSNEIKSIMNDYLLFCGQYELDHGHPIHISATSVVILAKDHSILQEYRKQYNEVTSKTNSSNELSCEQFIIAIKALEIKLDKKLDERHLDKDYHSWDKNQSTGLSIIEFEEYCIIVFGSTRRVVIKFMRDAIQHQREKDMREMNHLDRQYVIGLLPEPNRERFLNDIESLEMEGLLLKNYKQCLIVSYLLLFSIIILINEVFWKRNFSII